MIVRCANCDCDVDLDAEPCVKRRGHVFCSVCVEDGILDYLQGVDDADDDERQASQQDDDDHPLNPGIYSHV